MPTSNRILPQNSPPPNGNGQSSSFAANIAAHYDIISTPHPDGRGPMPPPVPRLGPITHLGGARMRLRDRLALRVRLLLSRPDGKGVADAG